MSTFNWPICVGGEYRKTGFPEQYAKVIAIDDDLVHYEFRRFDGKEHRFRHGNKISAVSFRHCFIPEDQSPIPALTAALKKVLPLLMEEQERREQACLPEPRGESEEIYLTEINDALEGVHAALSLVEERAA